jgi:hypothetical protein
MLIREYRALLRRQGKRKATGAAKGAARAKARSPRRQLASSPR